MIAHLLVGAAFATGPDVSLEAGGSQHADLPGQPAAWGAAWSRAEAGPVGLEGYGQLSWQGAPRGDLYVLTADGTTGNTSWTLGRQRVYLPSQPRVLDGAQVGWRSAHLDLDASAGIARAWSADQHAAMGRLSAEARGGTARLRAGLWGEAGEGGALILHPELRLRVGGDKLRFLGDVMQGYSDGGAGQGGESTRELVRAELRSHPLSGVDLSAHVEHREAPPVLTALAPAILATFAPDGLDEAGLELGVSGRGRGRTTGAVSLRRFDPDGQGDQIGAAASTALRLPGPAWVPAPSWRMATGPLGTVHLFQAQSQLPLPEQWSLAVHAGVAPYLEPFATWDAAWWTGASAGMMLGHWALHAGGDFGRSELAAFDPRAWLVLGWENR